MKQTLRQELLLHLRANGGWMRKGQLADVAYSLGYLGETAGRELRNMEVAKLIEVREDIKGHAEYKFINPDKLF
jgi:hypothetical protein